MVQELEHQLDQPAPVAAVVVHQLGSYQLCAATESCYQLCDRRWQNRATVVTVVAVAESDPH